MIVIHLQKSNRFRQRASVMLLAVLAPLLAGCAATQPAPNPGGPNPNGPPYPVLLSDESGVRRTAALAAWSALLREQGMAGAPPPELQPVTATLRGLPQTSSPLRLPKVGEGPTMNEEETREALRRFINSYHELLGIEPQQLSLVQRTDAADGSKRARYEQRPFRYPFRNGFGVVEISFTPDRRLLNVTSTAIPEIERLRLAGTGLTPRAELATPELVGKSLLGRTITYTDAQGRASTFTVTNQTTVIPREYVIYPLLREGEPPALEFHLTWEIAVEGAPVHTIYLDAMTNEIIAALA
jgi:hypothetical protein